MNHINWKSLGYVREGDLEAWLWDSGEIGTIVNHVISISNIKISLNLLKLID
jgi:hypothetical protein